MEEEFSASDLEVDSYIHYHEYDWGKKRPTLVVRGLFGSQGYDVDVETGELTRTCICAARHDSECCCGGYELLK